MAKLYLDCETCGLGGMPVLLQYAYDDGPVELYDIWTHPISETIELIESFLEHDLIGFNLAFDFFMLCKLYTTFVLYPDWSHYPEFNIDELAILEEKARFTDWCIKPKSAFDVMLHARKTKYQSLMERDDIKIRRVPTALAWQLSKELERRIKFDDIFFARSKDPFAPRWRIYDIKDPNGDINPNFKDIKLKFRASGGLKNLYRHAFQVKEDFFTYSDIEIDRKFWPFEYLFAPFALAVCPRYHETKSWTTIVRIGTAKHKRTVTAWPGVIQHHINHWQENHDARTYASNDVVYTRRLYIEHFGSPPIGDDDSILACMVAACRWRGYAVDLEAIRSLREVAVAKSKSVPVAPRVVKRYVSDAMDEIEKVALQGSTKKVVLEEISKWLDDNGKLHPAAVRAKQVLDARMALKEIELYDKILLAGRFHASFKVIGTLSSRMSGSDGLNPQGIKHTKDVRRAFTIADRVARAIEYTIDGIKRKFETAVSILNGGDFKSFEVSLAAKVFDDPVMTADLLSGIKVHGVMGMALFPGNTYEQILASEGSNVIDMYDIGKKGFFLKCYFGEAYTFNHKLGIPMETAEKADQQFNKKYPRVKKFQDGVRFQFGALSQPGGIGTKVEWRDPADYAENILGFRRYFTLENKVMKALFELAQKPPESFKNVTIKVQRRDRIQTAGGAVASALYGAAFAIMSANIRAAGNHYIQSLGALIAKAVQRVIWDLQPSGVTKWIVQPFNIHDEIMCPTQPGHEKKLEEVVKNKVTEYRKMIPLLAIDWMTNISSWAAKKGELVA